MPPLTQTSANCGFDNIPNEILVNILVLVSPLDVLQAALAYRRIADLTRSDWLWQLKLVADFPSAHPELSGESYLSAYIRLSSPKIYLASDQANVTWLDNRYWSRIPELESEFGQIVSLRWVWWMAADGEFRNVRPGQYEVVWRFKVVGNARRSLYRIRFGYEVIDGNMSLEEQPGEGFWHTLKESEWTEYRLSQRIIITNADAG
ncbi:hypothetical protein BC936DRAFT_141160, partial [Jimgerdemannia flammicorona]